MSGETALTDYEIATRVALAIARFFPGDAVFLFDVGTDWQRAPVYPAAIVAPESSDISRGSMTRAVTVRVQYRLPDGASKPERNAAGIMEAPGRADFFALLDRVKDALANGDLGAPVETISTAFDDPPQYPVVAAAVTVTLTDAHAYGDAF